MIPKIQTAKERESKTKRRNILMTLFVVVILGVSTAGYALMQNDSAEKKAYNGFTFLRTENGWQPKKIDLFTLFLPQEVENISYSGYLSIEDFKGNAYVIAETSEGISAANEFLKALPLAKMNRACLPEQENETFCNELPLKSCEDAGFGNSIIIFKENNETSIVYKNYCLEINGNGQEMIKASDKALFILYDIIK